MSLPEFDQLLTRFPIPGDPLGYTGTWREAAVRRGLLPVYSDWECAYALTREGQVVCSGDTDWADIRPLTNLRHRCVVLAQAADRYPALAALRPTRGATDPTCPTCKGAGRVPLSGPHQGTLLCECGGLGWYPAGSEPGPVQARPGAV